MSLVEQALKKAKAAGTPLPLSTAAPPAPEAPAAEASAPETVSATRAPATVELIEPSPDITATFKTLKSLEVDLGRLSRMGYLPPPEQQREIEEQFRHIKRPLLARALGRGMPRQDNGVVIMVTSALPGDGKTFSAVNLAMSLALEKDTSVLLVDADLIKPQAGKVFGLENEPGLVHALSDDSVDVETLVVQTSIPKLAVLPAGRTAQPTAELLSSARMATVIQRLKSYSGTRIILLDSPPLLITNEAKAFAELAGQVVLVVRANATPQRAVLDAIAFLREDQFVGAILNQSDTVSGSGYGYSYYGQLYKYGVSPGAAE
jgi:protein-tyrosine kinase